MGISELLADGGTRTYDSANSPMGIILVLKQILTMLRTQHWGFPAVGNVLKPEEFPNSKKHKNSFPGTNVASMRKKGGPEKKDPPRNSGGLPPASRRPAGLRKFCETMICWSATRGGSRDNSARRGPRERSAKPPRHSDKQKNLEPLRQPGGQHEKKRSNIL